VARALLKAMPDERPRDAASAVCDILALVWQIVHQCSLPGCRTRQMQTPLCRPDALDFQQLVKSLACLQNQSFLSASAFPSSVPRSHTPSKACDASSMAFTVGPFVDQYRDLNHVEPSDGKRTVSSYGSGLENRPFMPILNASVEIGGKKLSLLGSKHPSIIETLVARYSDRLLRRRTMRKLAGRRNKGSWSCLRRPLSRLPLTSLFRRRQPRRRGRSHGEERPAVDDDRHP
jgi:hypothetical protein